MGEARPRRRPGYIATVRDHNPFYQVMRWLVYGVSRLYLRIEFHGVENLPKTGAVLLVPNHASHLDPTSVTCGLPRPAHFLAKQELFKNTLGWFLRRVNSYPVRPSGVDIAAAHICLEVLDRGLMLVIFPEGQRTETGAFLPFKSGAAMLATKTGAMIVPVYISGSYESMPPKSHFPKPGKINVYLGVALVPPEPSMVHAEKRLQYSEINAAILEQWVGMRLRHDGGAR